MFSHLKSTEARGNTARPNIQAHTHMYKHVYPQSHIYTDIYVCVCVGTYVSIMKILWRRNVSFYTLPNEGLKYDEVPELASSDVQSGAEFLCVFVHVSCA